EPERAWLTFRMVRFGRLLRSVRLERLPLRDQVPDLPHQRLMPVGHRFGGFEVVVEAGRGHRRFELLDLLFALGDARLEFGDALLKSIRRTLTLLPFRIVTFSFVARRRSRPASRTLGVGSFLGFGLWDLGFVIF